jgi:hypothetical protein
VGCTRKAAAQAAKRESASCSTSAHLHALPDAASCQAVYELMHVPGAACASHRMVLVLQQRLTTHCCIVAAEHKAATAGCCACTPPAVPGGYCARLAQATAGCTAHQHGRHRQRQSCCCCAQQCQRCFLREAGLRLSPKELVLANSGAVCSLPQRCGYLIRVLLAEDTACSPGRACSLEGLLHALPASLQRVLPLHQAVGHLRNQCGCFQGHRLDHRDLDSSTAAACSSGQGELLGGCVEGPGMCAWPYTLPSLCIPVVPTVTLSQPGSWALRGVSGIDTAANLYTNHIHAQIPVPFVD